MTRPLILTALTAALLSALTIAATAWAHDPVITTAACVICGMVAKTALRNVRMGGS